MAKPLVINGLDLSEIGIGDVPRVVHGEQEWADSVIRQLLGSITFGPMVVDWDADVVDDVWEDDEDWEYAE